MKTYKEIHQQWNVENKTEYAQSVTNVDDVLRWARNNGTTDLIMDEYTMVNEILRFSIGDSQVVPWEYIADAWIPRVYGINFHKEI